MGTLSGARSTVVELARTRHPNDFTPLVPALGDVGRAFANPRTKDLRAMLSSIAALRENLDFDEQHYRDPALILRGEKAPIFVSGALWASSVLINALLAKVEADAGDAKSSS